MYGHCATVVNISLTTNDLWDDTQSSSMPDIEDVKFISHSFISCWEMPGLYTLINKMGKSHSCSNS